MKLDRVASGFDATPETALESVLRFDGDVLIDLDETLYLRNSTEDFIDTARPALIAYVLLRLLDVLRPWRWTGADTRDVWRIRLILLLLPWTLPLRRRRVSELAGRFGNAPLRQAVAGRPASPVIVTLGFRPVVTPLVAALGLPAAPIVAARVWHAADRRDGKLALAQAALGLERLQRSLFVTDSPLDRPVLDICACPLLTTGPKARYRPALAGLYVPGRYLTQVKRPNTQYIRRSILQDDFALWVLSSIWLAAVPALHVLGLLALLVSFWAIYEQGYVDNDRIAARFEAQPRLSAAFGTAEVSTPRLAPWIWAAVSGWVGIALLNWPGRPEPVDGVKWAAVLVATATCFAVFNRIDKASRVWPYAGLQLGRCAAFATLVPVVPIAPAVIGAHVIEKWVPYYVYRLRGDPAKIPFHLVRFNFVVLLSFLVAARDGAQVLVQWPTLALVGFTALKAQREFRAVIAAASRIDRGERRSPSAPASEAMATSEGLDGAMRATT